MIMWADTISRTGRGAESQQLTAARKSVVWPSSHFTQVLGSGRHRQSSTLEAGVRQLTAGWRKGRQCPLTLALGLALSTGVSATGSTSSVLDSQAHHEPPGHGYGWPPEDPSP